MISNFEFLAIDIDTAELFRTVNMAEENYTHGDYEGTLTKVRKVAENTASESSIMKLATSPCSKIFVSLSLSKPVISFDNRLEAVRLSCQG